LILGCSAKDKELTAKQITLPYSDIMLEYAVHGNKNSASCPIIALHGFIDSWYTYYLLMRSMPDIRIYSLSLPCYGSSTKDPIIASSYDKLANIVVEFMDALKIPSAYIMGHSMSSMLAPRIALLYPDRVSGIISLGTVGSLALNPDLVQLVESLEDSVEAFHLSPEDSFPEDFVFGFLNTYPENISTPLWYLDGLLEQSMKVPVKCWLAGADMMVDFNQLEELKNLELPYLIIYGDLDLIVWDAEKGGPEAVVLNVPDITVTKLHGVGHDPHWQVPKKVAAIIRGFLRTQREISLL